MTHARKPGSRRKPVVRDPWYVRARRHGGIAAGVASLGVAAVATLGSSPATVATVATAADVAPASQGDIVTEALDGSAPVRASRSSVERAPLPSTVEAEARIEGSLYAQKTLPVRADAAKDSPVLATIGKGKKVPVTGKTRGGLTEIIHNDLSRWVATKLIDDSRAQARPHRGHDLAGARARAARRSSPACSPTPCASTAPCAPASRRS